MHRSRLSTRATLLPFLLFAAACRPAEPSPEQVVESLVNDLASGRTQAAWDVLSDETRAALRKRWTALHGEGRGEPTPDDLVGLLGAEAVAQPQRVVLVSLPGDRQTMRIIGSTGASAEIPVVRTEDGWRVDLLAALEPAPTTSTVSTGRDEDPERQ